MKKTIVYLFFWLALVCASAAAVRLSINQDKTGLVDHLTTVLNNCTDTKTRNACIKKQAISDLNTFPFTKILSALEVVQSKNLPYQYHDYLHFLAIEQYYRNPNLSTLFTQCTPVFFNACYHGVVIGLLNTSDFSVESAAFKDKMSTTCNDFQSDDKAGFFEQCIHGVGHAVMIASNYELSKALTLCDALATQKSTCYGGVFMENFPQSSSTDAPSKYLPTSSDAYYPCDKLAAEYQEQCFIFLSIYQNHVGTHDWSETAKFCLGTPEVVRDECFGTIGNSVIPTTENIRQLKDVCDVTKDATEDRVYCYLGIVGSFDDKYGGNNSMLGLVVDYCDTLPDAYQKYCYERTARVFTKWLSEKDQTQFCDKIKNEEYKKLCSKRIKISD